MKQVGGKRKRPIQSLKKGYQHEKNKVKANTSMISENIRNMTYLGKKEQSLWLLKSNKGKPAASQPHFRHWVTLNIAMPTSLHDVWPKHSLSNLSTPAEKPWQPLSIKKKEKKAHNGWGSRGLQLLPWGAENF